MEAVTLRPYVCDVCGKQFAKSNALTMHKRFKHPAAPPDQVQVEVSENGETVLSLAGEPITEVVEPAELATAVTMAADDPMFETLLLQINTTIEMVEREYQVAQQRYQHLADQLKRLRSMQRAAGGAAPPEPRKTTTKGKVRIGEKNMEKIVAFLDEHPDEQFTQKEVKEAVGTGSGTGDGLRFLRDTGRIRKVGMRQNPQGAPSPLYQSVANYGNPEEA